VILFLHVFIRFILFKLGDVDDFGLNGRVLSRRTRYSVDGLRPGGSKELRLISDSRRAKPHLLDPVVVGDPQVL
jgi:hypothetical protein